MLDHYIEHYNTHRPHQSLGQTSPQPRPVLTLLPEHEKPHRVERKEVLGGLIHEYHHAA